MLLKISTATRKQFCTDYLPVVSNIGPLTMTQAERQLSLSGLHLLLRPGHVLGFVSTPRHRTRDIESIWRAFFIGCQRGDAAAGAVMGILEVLMPDDLLPTIYISNSAKSAVVAGEMLL